MQVFLLNKDPALNAQSYMDKHVIKIPNDILSILLHAKARLRQKFPQIRSASGMPMMPSPKILGTPLVKWAASNQDNYDWLLATGHHLLMEYARRFKEQHFLYENFMEFECNCSPALWFMWVLPLPTERANLLEKVAFNRYPWILPMAFQNKEAGIVASYQQYYIEVKKHLAKWSPPSSRPVWYPESAVEEGAKIAASFKAARKAKKPDSITTLLTSAKPDESEEY